MIRYFYRRQWPMWHHLMPLAFFLSVAWQVFAGDAPQKFSAQKASFSVAFKDEVTPYRVMGVFVLPNEVLQLSVHDSSKYARYELRISGGKILNETGNRWQWQAPDKNGLYPLKVCRQSAIRDSITLNVLVMIPFAELQGEYLNHYRIGKYPDKPLKGRQIYQPPHGFIEVTSELEQTAISPHFKLYQFLCKQDCEASKYVVLEERLILKLELVLEEVNAKGYPCTTFQIMSGYRTPHYNQAIGNVRYSRHCWGAAADIFIDENPKDGMMDDLNRDGSIDIQDAKVLHKIIEQLQTLPEHHRFIGGLASYKANASHGPFVHLDVRGYIATWGE
ncbi:MAG: D-Ala-D-Ala carboxypeptidase family metallohydrolase [candidate division KSB1 bacterium]|nr:D-Ala-D-Ala carboxypeptidase family metallohydrolase [candidate division KSB1 bacterium]